MNAVSDMIFQNLNCLSNRSFRGKKIFFGMHQNSIGENIVSQAGLLGILVLAPNSFHGSHVFLVIIIVAIA